MNKNITIDDHMMQYESDMNHTVHMAADLIKRRFVEESYDEAIKYSNNMCDSVLKLLRKDYDHIIGKIQYYFIELQRINKEEYDELMSHALNRFDFWQNTTIMNFWRGAQQK